MSYLFEFDKDYHSSSDSDYNPESESESDSEYESESDSEYESDSDSEGESELCVTPVKERPQTMPLTPVKKRPILRDVPIDVELVSQVRPLKTVIQRDVNSNWKNNPKESGRPIRERKQPIRYQA